MEMRSVLTMSPKQMDDWRAICKEYAKQQNAVLLFCNETSCGLQYNDGSLRHLTIEDLVEELRAKEKLNG